MCKYSHPYYDCIANYIIKPGFNQTDLEHRI